MILPRRYDTTTKPKQCLWCGLIFSPKASQYVEPELVNNAEGRQDTSPAPVWTTVGVVLTLLAMPAHGPVRPAGRILQSYRRRTGYYLLQTRCGVADTDRKKGGKKHRNWGAEGWWRMGRKYLVVQIWGEIQFSL